MANVATLPGIVGPSLAMPDIHWGYGFAIGGVAAFDLDEGRGLPRRRGLRHQLRGAPAAYRRSSREQVAPLMKTLVDALFSNIPSGVGSRRQDFKLTGAAFNKVLKDGCRWAVKEGFGEAGDLAHIEAGGAIHGADPEAVSDFALNRGKDQLGTLGSGNHFVEVGYVDEIYDAALAAKLGLFPGQVTAIVHTGSRGLGHQVCEDYIKVMLKASAKYGIELPDRQLCCAPLTSPEGKRYLAAMAGAANFAFANRQLITHWVRESFEQVLGIGPRDLGMELVYDVCHNIAKIETHTVEGKPRKLCVHRKGATRAFPPHHPEVPAGLPGDRAAGAHPRGHGALLFRIGGDRKGPYRDLRQHLPRGGARDEPPPGQEGGPGPVHHPGVGGQRHHRPGRGPGHHRRRDFRGLQRRFRRGGRGPRAPGSPGRWPG